MTREEAIARIKNHKIVHKMNEPRAIYISEALDMAIKALEQEPCDDAISRNAVTRVLNNMDRYVTDELKLCDTCKKFPANEVFVVDDVYEEIVESLPSVHPKPKTGHWTRELIRNEKGGCIGAKRICSRCGNDNKHDEYMNFCPNCGAKMVESQESEEE